MLEVQDQAGHCLAFWMIFKDSGFSKQKPTWAKVVWSTTTWTSKGNPQQSNKIRLQDTEEKAPSEASALLVWR